MTQYSTNANFSTDIAGTQAYADGGANSTKITGFTALAPTGSFNNLRTSTITAGGTIGADFVRMADGGYGSASQILAQNGPGSIAANTITEILFHIRFNALPSSGDMPVSPYVRWGTNNGYVLSTGSTGSNVTLLYWTGAVAGSAIGASVLKNLTAGTWYWGRINVDGSGNWKWKIWSGAFSAEPGWDVSAGATDTTATAGNVGPAAIIASGSPSTMPVDYDWFSSATAGDPAPGPTVPSTQVPYMPYGFQPTLAS